jgi:hypothetical protein
MGLRAANGAHPTLTIVGGERIELASSTWANDCSCFQRKPLNLKMFNQ